MRRRSIRALAGPILAAALAILAASPASAGGWATVLVDREGSGSTGHAGEPVAVVFTVLQHGVTPVDREVATVVATDAAAGGQVRVVATADGVAGRYRATLILPHEGTWRWQVELGELVAQSQFHDVAVTAALIPPGAQAERPTAAGVDLGAAVLVGIGGGLLAAGFLAILARRRKPATSRAVTAP